MHTKCDDADKMTTTTMMMMIETVKTMTADYYEGDDYCKPKTMYYIVLDLDMVSRMIASCHCKRKNGKIWQKICKILLK